MPRSRPKSLVEVDGKLHSAVWGISRRKPSPPRNIWTTLMALSLSLPMSRNARKRLRWFFDCANVFKGNVRKTCRYHGIPPKTFYYWKKRFDPRNPRSLEDRSRRPKIGPLPVLHLDDALHIFELRSKYPHYSKMKIAMIMNRRGRGMKQKISSWQVQKIIEKYDLYPDPIRARRIARKRKNAFKKERIAGCPIEPWTGWLVSMDTVVVNILNEKRFILTAIDHHSRLLCARAYTRLNSKVAADFLVRVYDFLHCHMQNVHTDNGAEFHDKFEAAAKQMQIRHWWSRSHTPKDNAMNERVNRTLQEEFLPAFRYCTDLAAFNDALGMWMLEYNQERPHTALGYKTPYEVSCASRNPFEAFYDSEEPDYVDFNLPSS